MLNYCNTKAANSLDLIIADGAVPRQHLSVGRGGVKFSRSNHFSEDVASQLSLEEISAVLAALGKAQPETIEQGILDVDGYWDEKENNIFHFIVQFPKSGKRRV